MKLIYKIKPLFKKLNAFDWLFIIVLVASVIFIAITSLKKTAWVTAEFKVSIPGTGRLSYLAAENLNQGDFQLNQSGEKNLEVLKVFSWGNQQKDMWITAKLNVNVNKSNKYSFNYQPLEIGKPVEATIKGIYVRGIVTWLENIPDTRKRYAITIKARLVNDTNPYSTSTRGVDPWLADGLEVGQQMKDTTGRIVAEITDLTVKPAERTVQTGDGRIYLGEDPLKKDVFLTLKIQTTKNENDYYFLEDLPVKIGYFIPVLLGPINISPVITEIVGND
jgi:hypothetical protein